MKKIIAILSIVIFIGAFIFDAKFSKEIAPFSITNWIIALTGVLTISATFIAAYISWMTWRNNTNDILRRQLKEIHNQDIRPLFDQYLNLPQPLLPCIKDREPPYSLTGDKLIEQLQKSNDQYTLNNSEIEKMLDCLAKLKMLKGIQDDAKNLEESLKNLQHNFNKLCDLLNLEGINSDLKHQYLEQVSNQAEMLRQSYLDYSDKFEKLNNALINQLQPL